MKDKQKLYNWKSLEEKFIKRSYLDKVELGLESIYFPNPKISLSPEFCLIAMEPSVGKSGLEKVKNNIERGYRNFMYSEEDFILHYCAYHYLCGGNFNYYITDISKGAMKTKIANKYRKERYNKWLPLLVEELQLLGDPKVISVGKSVQGLLDNNDVTNNRILHYSWNNSMWIKKRYNEVKNRIATKNDTLKRLIDFSNELMSHVGYNKEMKKDRLLRIFNEPLSEWKQCLMGVYKYDFLNIKK